MKKEIDAYYIIKSLGLKNKPKLNLYFVMCSNLKLVWVCWCWLWGVLGVLYNAIRLINYYT